MLVGNSRPGITRHTTTERVLAVSDSSCILSQAESGPFWGTADAEMTPPPFLPAETPMLSKSPLSDKPVRRGRRSWALTASWTVLGVTAFIGKTAYIIGNDCLHREDGLHHRKTAFIGKTAYIIGKTAYIIGRLPSSGRRPTSSGRLPSSGRRPTSSVLG